MLAWAVSVMSIYVAWMLKLTSGLPTREVLIEIIIRQQAIIESLEKRIAQLEGRAKAKGSGRMPGLKPKADGKPAPSRKPRKGRSHGFARVRMAPTRRVEHAVERCPDCAARLSGGWTHRTREVD